MTAAPTPKPGYGKPLPTPNEISQPFWDGLREGRLRIQQSVRTGTYIFYPRAVSPFGADDRLRWVDVGGRGIVYSHTVARRPAAPPWAEDVPYVYAIVELEEGPRLTTNIVGCDPDSVRIGMAVEAVFDAVTPEITLLKFKPSS